MEDKMARLLSVLLHPILVPTWFFLIVYSIPQVNYSLFSPRYLLVFGSFIFILTFILPALTVLIMKVLNLVSSFSMEQRNERFIPLLLMAVIYYVTFFLLQRTGVQSFQVFSLFMLGSSMVTLILLVLNYFTKVSLHMAAWGGLTGALTGLSYILSLNLFFWLFLVVFLSGLTAYARLENKAHQPVEIYVGYLTGYSLMLILFLFVGAF